MNANEWLMNMPVSPEKDADGNRSKEWEDWVKSRHSGNYDHHFEEWDKFLEGRIIGEPMTQRRPASEYKAAGWVGIYRGLAKVEVLKLSKKLSNG